jgi:hypothetical protein
LILYASAKQALPHQNRKVGNAMELSNFFSAAEGDDQMIRGSLIYQPQKEAT